MEYIRVTKENLEKEHICCAISNNKDIQVSSKKAWLADRFDEGLVFLKSVERGKCFIEYIPAECAWNPIEAPGYMYINCLWVSGSFKGHGYSSDLLSECIEDSKEKGKKGLCILAAARKKPFLADSKFLKYKGFKAMYLIKESAIKAWRDTNGLHFIQCVCRFTENCVSCGGGRGSKRDEMKELVAQFRNTSSVIETNIFNSVRDINLRTVMGYHKDGEYYNFLDDYDQRGNKGADKEKE